MPSPSLTSRSFNAPFFLLLLCWPLFTSNGQPVVWANAMPAPPEIPATPTLPAATDVDWWSTVQRDLQTREYHASPTDHGLQAPNRAQDFRTYFAADGIRLVAREAAEPADLLRLRLDALGRGEARSPVSSGEVTSQGNRVEIRRDGLVEWYENTPAGLEQGFTLSARPRGAGDLVLHLQVSGATVQPVEDGVELVTAADRRLRYGKLAIRDASGREVPGRIEGKANLIQLVIAAAATYPLVIDPLLTGTADATLEQNQASAILGWSVAGATLFKPQGVGTIINDD